MRDQVRYNSWNVASAADTNSRVVVFAVLFVLCGVVAHQVGPLVWAVCWFVAGWLLVGALAACHEAIHNNLYQSRASNRTAGWLWAGAVAIPFETYRAYHRAHHADTGGPSDPEPRVTIRSRWMYMATFAVSGLWFWVEMWAPTVTIMFGGRGPVWVNDTARRRVRANGWALTAAIVVVGVSVPVGVLAVWWVGPIVVTALLCAPLVTMPEHHRTSPGPGPATATSRTVVSVWVCRFVLWNANFHTAHHMVPSVPGRNLELLDAVIVDDCEHRTDTYLGWHRREFDRLHW